MTYSASVIQASISDKWQVVLMMLGLGSLFLFIGVANIRNVRRARSTGIVATSIKSLGPATYDRRKNPVLYKLTFGSSAFAAAVALCVGLGAIGFGIFVLVTW